MLYTQKVLFSHFWDFEHNIQNYVISPFPGRKKGISGSCIGGYLLGINKYISDERKKAAAVVLKYFTSAEFQKKFVIKYYQSYSGMNILYDDEEVCSYVDCKLIKNIQGIERPSAIVDNYESYSNKITNLIFEFLYNGKSVTETLREIDDFTKISYYYIKYSFLNFSIFLILIIEIAIILSIYIIISKSKKYFNFLSLDLWTIYTIGVLLIVISALTYFGKVTSIKCYLNHIFLSSGLSFSLIPLFYRLLINFPFVNKYTNWIKMHKWVFIGIFLFIEILFSLLMLLSPYYIENIVSLNYKNYNKCKMEKHYKATVLFFQIINKVIMYICINILIYMEWSIQETIRDVRVLLIMMSLNAITFILFIMSYIITIDDYHISYSIYLCIIILFGFTNYLLPFILRVIHSRLVKSKTERDKFEDKIFNMSVTTPTFMVSLEESFSQNQDEDGVKNIDTVKTRRSTKIDNNRNSILSVLVTCHNTSVVQAQNPRHSRQSQQSQQSQRSQRSQRSQQQLQQTNK